jgi:quercetin dioxygenase-like cupin family protein/catechol 2,3-dioxygenase-like lactoylglutathione lyase family enzyme
MKLVRAQDPLPSAKDEHFTGRREFDPRLREQRLAGMRVAVATFIDGGRTLWHRHHGEQVLYVLSGRGWVQKDGEDASVIERGDVAYVAPGEKHWHGTRTGQYLKHLAVTTGETEWEEEVKDELQGATDGSGATRARRWEHSALAVADLNRAISFYREAFAYDVVFKERGVTQIGSLVGLDSVEGDLAQLRSPISGHVLELVEFRNVPPGGEEHPPTRPGFGHLSFVVDDLGTALTAVEQIGGSRLGKVTWFEEGPRAYCRDPSGTTIELAEHRTRP